MVQIQNKELKRRIIAISYKKGLSHLGSCLTACDIIEEIYNTKKPDEKFVLSSGHAGLALYCVLEKHGGRNAEDIFDHHGVHPDRCSNCDIDCSSGSLGHGIGIAVGIALGNRSRHVYVLLSDGECAEGSVWEALRIAQEQNLTNLQVYVNINSWGAYKEIDANDLIQQLNLVFPLGSNKYLTDVDYLPFLNQPTPQSAHYKVLNEEEYKEAMEILK